MSQSPEDLDHTPITFGKYKGVTPSDLASTDPQYLRWMYENVTNKATCSAALYKDCANKKAPAVKSWKPAGSSPKIKDHFDSYDGDDEDDIAF